MRVQGCTTTLTNGVFCSEIGDGRGGDKIGVSFLMANPAFLTMVGYSSRTAAA